MKRLLLLAAVLPLLAAKDDPLAGRVAGKPQQCINLSQLNGGPVIVDETTILYRDGPRVWRTGPRGACPALERFSTLIVDVWSGQLCSGDRFRPREPGMRIPGQTCLFRDFTPYIKAPAAR